MPARQGFTLLEILLVMAILVILTAVSLPSLQSMYGDTRVRGAGDEVRNAWAEARSRSIDSGMPYRFAVNGGSQYRVAPDTAEFWDGASAASDTDDGRAMIGSLPKNINFAPSDSADDSSGWRTVVVFLPDGTCRNDALIVIETDGSPALYVRARALTGIVSVKTPRQEGR